jgi:flagellar hook-associated protein 2
MGMDISGLTGGGAAALSEDMLTQLRAEDEKVTVKPAEEKLEKFEKSSESYDIVKESLSIFQQALEPFTQGADNNVFDSLSTSVQGDAVLYDATGTLLESTSNINVTQLASRDVWQSDNTISSEDALVGAGDFKITIGGEEHTFATTVTTTVGELAEMINKNENFNGSISQVGDDTFRLIVKSTETGSANEMSFDTSSLSGINFDDANGSHVQTAQNLNATIDGVSYETSSNKVQINDTLSMTAVNIGTSSIDIQKDPNTIIDSINLFVEAFNALTDTVNNATTYDGENEETGNLQNSSIIKDILTAVKTQMFGSYGDGLESDGTTVEEKHNIYQFGFELDRYGKLSVDQDVLATKMSEAPEDIEELFKGTPTNKGLVETMHEYVDGLDGLNGALSLYETSMDEREISIQEEKEKAVANLDNKYDNMKLQFARYAVLITQMESSFSSLEYTIKEATSSSD